MLPRHTFLLLSLITTIETAAAEASTRIEAEASPARITVAPPEEGRKLLHLPDLGFRLNIKAQCGENHHPASLSVSVADTRKTLIDEEIAGKQELVVEISIPASQVSPIPVDDFCSLEGPEVREMLVRNALIAHLSLRCAGSDGESITYTTSPLAVALTCDIDAQGDSESLMLR